MRARYIPKFKTYKQEARFWDTHSTEDFPGEFQTVKVKFARPLRILLVIPLESATMRKLERISKAQGTKPIALARQWIMERVASAGR